MPCWLAKLAGWLEWQPAHPPPTSACTCCALPAHPLPGSLGSAGRRLPFLPHTTAAAEPAEVPPKHTTWQRCGRSPHVQGATACTLHTHCAPAPAPPCALAPYSHVLCNPAPAAAAAAAAAAPQGLDALGYKEHIDYDVVQSNVPAFGKAVVRVNIFRNHRQVRVRTWPYCGAGSVAPKEARCRALRKRGARRLDVSGMRCCICLAGNPFQGAADQCLGRTR